MHGNSKAIIKLYTEGASVIEITKLLNLTRAKVYYILEREQIPVRERVDMEQVKQLHQGGMTVSQISKTLNISRSTIYRRLGGKSIFAYIAQDMRDKGFSIEAIAEDLKLTVAEVNNLVL